jgi:predicted nucleic acid-binding protein
VTVHFDTSVLIDILTRDRPLLAPYEHGVTSGHRMEMSTIALYEWLRGPRSELEIRLLGAICPKDRIVRFGPAEAELAADLYRTVKRARGREADIAIAACAIEHEAAIWTTNPRDFQDIPGVKLYAAAGGPEGPPLRRVSRRQT